MSLSKLCPRCRKVIDISEQYCDFCAKKAEEDRLLRLAKYRERKKEGIVESNDPFYNSPIWRRTSKACIAGYFGIDVYEFVRTGRVMKADVVHHIVPVKDDWGKRFNLKNLIPLSRKNHDIIEKIYKTTKKKEMQAELIMMCEKFHALFMNERGGPYAKENAN